jgi:hypothetical protein
MKNNPNSLWKWLFGITILAVLVWIIWQVGRWFAWDWGEFWLNFISNAASSAVIGFVLYWIITRPDEKKSKQERKNQALAMLKIEFEINLERARLYGGALKRTSSDFSALYPLRFTRGAWNALKESGFLPQLEDVGFVYELLRVNEVITVANNSLLKVRNAKADKEKAKLNTYAKKAVKECAQIEILMPPIVEKLESMKLPEVKLPAAPDIDEDNERD